MRPLLLVTGGSRGIGAAICRHAAREGYDLAIHCRAERAAADAVAAECRAAGAGAWVFEADLAALDGPNAGVDRLFAALDAELPGRLTHMVNNAGLTGRFARLVDADPAEIRRVVDVNVTAAILAARAAAARLCRSRGGPGGVIVNISSGAATLGSPGEYVWYAATKGAIDALTIGLGRELASDGVRVCGAAPGLTETTIHAEAGAPDRVARMGPTVPLGRAADPAEIAAAVLFLLSDSASYVTATTLRIAGGR